MHQTAHCAILETTAMNLNEKSALLDRTLKSLGSLLVAYSGGTDSAYLAFTAHRMLGDRMLAVIADSPSLPRQELAAALAFTADHGIPTHILQTTELDKPDYIRNDAQRCFHCKDELFTRLEIVARERGIEHIAYGVNVDDLGDYRPGQKAAKLHQAKAPLVDAGLSKAEIRELSRLSGLSTWDRPAAACLSSRIPYGTPVTLENIKTVERGEEAIRQLGFRQFRVRFHGQLVRIEIAKDELAAALTPEMAQRFVQIFKPLGFHYVTIDLEGYRQGSLNAVLAG